MITKDKLLEELAKAKKIYKQEKEKLVKMRMEVDEIHKTAGLATLEARKLYEQMDKENQKSLDEASRRINEAHELGKKLHLAVNAILAQQKVVLEALDDVEDLKNKIKEGVDVKERLSELNNTATELNLEVEAVRRERENLVEKLEAINKTAEKQKESGKDVKGSIRGKVESEEQLSHYKESLKTELEKKVKVEDRIVESKVKTTIPLDDATWGRVKEKIQKYNGTTFGGKDKEGRQMIVLMTGITVKRETDGVSTSTNNVPPNIAELVRNQKIASQEMGDNTCYLESIRNKEDAIKIIQELAKEPYPMKPVITNQRLLDELRQGREPECIKAMEIYEKMNNEPENTSKLRV